MIGKGKKRLIKQKGESVNLKIIHLKLSSYKKKKKGRCKMSKVRLGIYGIP